MKLVIKILIISTLCFSLSRGYSIESKVKKQNNFDGGVAMKVFNGKSKVKINKREHIDNVRDEHMPKSREDIQNIKKLTYHGKMSPKAEPLIQKTTTPIKVTSTTQRPRGRRHKKKISPVNRADRITMRKKFKPSQKLPSSNELVRSAITKPEKPNYIPYDTPFYPLMRPSPINVMPTAPPTFDTIRNYVQYLKMRNEKNYAEINDNDDEVSPLAAPLSNSQKKKSNVPYDGEVEYFQQREKEIFKEQQRNRSSDESNSEDVDDHQQHPYKVYEHNDNYDDMSQNESEDYDDNTNDESRHRDFVPFKLYAQVRHAEAEHIEPAVRPHVKEKVSLAKKNIYYKEEGYDDRMHDKGSEELKYKFKSKKKGHKRSKRNVDDLPLALALFKKSELPKLTGEKLLKHLDELIKNSSVYLSDDDEDRPVKIVSKKQSGRSRKFPFHNLSENVLSQMSAHRYSENFHTYPQHKESLYSSKNIKDCQEINDEVDIDESEESPPPKRLTKLGSKIECLKLKYFGKDPFDNPLFKEDEYVAATIPLPFNHTNVISRQANPLINVYDDVIRTIRAENFAEEKKKSQEVVKDSTKLASEKIQIRAVTPRIPNYSSVAGVSSLPIFDINKYLPKYRPAFNINDDDETDITELLYGKNTTERNKSYFTSTPPIQITTYKKPNRQNSLTSASSHKIESSTLIEKPKVKRNFKAKSSERSSPLKALAGNKNQVTIQKFRRVTPQKLHSSVHPPTRASPYRFKFL